MTVTTYTREVTAIREKFVGLKTLGIEGQGHEHGSFFFLYKKIMEEKDINQTIIKTLRGAAHEFGKMTSPTAGVDTKGKSKKGKSYEGFTFGISAKMDGEVKVFGKNFILINWQIGRRWENQVCRSLNEAEKWFCSKEWSGNTEEKDSNG